MGRPGGARRGGHAAARPPRRLRAGVVAATLLAACSGAAGPTAAPAPPRPAHETLLRAAPTSEDVPLSVDVERPRYLAAQERLEVIVVNEGPTTVSVADVRLLGGGFADVAAVARPAELRPGQRTDVQVRYGEAVCSARGRSDAGRVALTVDDGDRRRSVVLPIPAASDVLARLHAEGCFAQQLADTVAIGLADRWTPVPGRAALRGELRLTRVGTSPRRVAVDDVAGNVVFSLTPLGAQAPPLLVLEPDQPDAALRVEVDATRCEPHALAESKKTFRFPVWIALGDAAPRYVELEATGATRFALQGLVDECAAAAG